MVQVFNATPTASNASMIGNALGVGLNKRSPDPQQLVQRGMLQEALQKAKMAVKEPGATPLDKIFSVMEAGAGIPGSERYLGALLPLVQQLTQAEAAQNAPFGIGNEGQQPSQSPNISNLENQLNNFLQPNQGNAFYPSNEGNQQAPGNLPQAATAGIKAPVLSNQQLLQLSKPYAKKKTEAGIPTKPQEAYEELKAINADNQEANKLVETERKERVASQREYGQIAENKLRSVYPDAGNEEAAYIKKQVEQLAGENSSEADIERLASAEVRKYKNLISKVDQDIPATRSYNRPFRKLMGNEKSAGSARKDLKLKIQPLLDAGLYDKARNLLSNKGYYPEEREMIITDLGENSLKNINLMPRISTDPERALEDGYDRGKPEIFKQNLRDVLQSDPSTNLILLRRKYEMDKGVDWRLFKDSINDLVNEGVFKPNDDQFNQLNNLDQPPLDRLDKLLYGLGLIGR